MLSVKLGCVASCDVIDKRGDEFFSHIHEVIDISISHIKLERGELGVVSKVDALVPFFVQCEIKLRSD